MGERARRRSKMEHGYKNKSERKNENVFFLFSNEDTAVLNKTERADIRLI